MANQPSYIRTVGTIPGSLILGIAAAIGVLTMQPLMPEQYLLASPLVKRPAVAVTIDQMPEPVLGS